MSERQNAFTIKTNQLCDVVYENLEKYAKSRKLGDYISALILRDLEQTSSEHDSSTKENNHKMFEHISKELDLIKGMLQSQVHPLQVPNREGDVKLNLSTDEGKISDLSAVTGFIEDKDLVEYSDF